MLVSPESAGALRFRICMRFETRFSFSGITFMYKKYWLLAPLLASLGCGNQPGPDCCARTAVVAAAPASDAVAEEPMPGSAKKEEPPAPPVKAASVADAEAAKLLTKMTEAFRPLPTASIEVKGASVRAIPAKLLDSQPMLTDATLTAVPYRAKSKAEPRPTALPERVPLELAQAILDVPERAALPTGALVNNPARDITRPADLPILARPTVDRASLEDPTADFTAASIINLKIQVRTAQAPFVKVNLPDPFEFIDNEARKMTIKEDPAKVLSPQPSPKR